MTKRAHRVSKLQCIPSDEAVVVGDAPPRQTAGMQTPRTAAVESMLLPDSSTEGWNNFDLLRLMAGDSGMMAVNRSASSSRQQKNEAKLARFESPRHNTFCCPEIAADPLTSDEAGAWDEEDTWQQLHTMPTGNFSNRRAL